MQSTAIGEAITWLEKSNADLQPELLTAEGARDLLASYARAEKLASYGKAMLARKLDDATEAARASGTSMGKAQGHGGGRQSCCGLRRGPGGLQGRRHLPGPGR